MPSNYARPTTRAVDFFIEPVVYNADTVDNGRALAGALRETLRKLDWSLPATNPAAAGSTGDAEGVIETWDFDQTTEEHADVQVPVPTEYDDTDITLTFFWTADAGAGTVGWEVNAANISNDDPRNAALSDRGTALDTLIATGDLHVVSITLTASLPTAGDMWKLRISRDVAADTLTGDAKLIMVRVDFN